MSRPRFLRSVVFLSAFVAPTVVSSAQRQNTSEPLASPSPLSSRRAAPTKTRQAVPVPGVPFDLRRRLHGPGASTPQTTSQADPLTAATLATGTSLSASTMFLEAPVFSSGGYSANSVAVADVNGDGKLDLLVANFCTSTPCGGDGTVAVLLGNGDGTFQPAVTYDSGGQNAVSIAVADVNSDGKPDAVVTDNCVTSTCDAGAVGVLLGNGDGTFQAAVNYTSGGLSPSSVVVGDVNGDGKPDLLVGNIYMGNGNYSRGSVGLLLGNGDGTFLGPVSFDSGGEYAYGVAVGDINGDGKLDLFVANFCADSTCASGGVAVFLGKGDGSFQPVVTYGSGGLDSYSVAVGDVNEDGKPDLLVANYYSADGNYYSNGTVGVLLGNGDGTFQAAVSYGSGGSGPVSLAVGDVNGDGKPDLLVANQCASSDCTNGTVGVLFGKGNSTFGRVVSYESGGYQASWVAVADVSGDGRPDLLVANQCASSNNCANGTIGVLLQNADGSFQTAVSYPSGGYYAYSLGVSDVNGDGKPDLVVANQCATNSSCANGIVGVLLGNGDGTFQPALAFSSGGKFAFSVAIADVNGDGKPDLLIANEYASTANQSTGTVAVLLGNGDGTFQPAVTYGSGGQYFYTVAIADVNGDGRPDLLLANQCAIGSCTGGTLGALLGTGNATFQPAVISSIPQARGGQQLAIADFDGNGTLDVASGAGNFLLLGNGDGTFQPALILGADGPGIAVGDFNLDGKPDLAVGGVTILLNISSATTRTPTTTTLSSSPNPSIVDQTVNFVATVVAQNGGSPSGTVTFKDGANTIGTASVVTCNCASRGTATLPLSTLGAGTHTITAVYGGDVTFTGSTSSAITQTVLPKTATTTALSSSLNPSYVGQSVTFTAAVSPSGASGTVTFYDGTTILGTGSLNSSGQASSSTSTLAAGSHKITASYGGESYFTHNTSAALTQTVNKFSTSTALTLSPNTTAFGQPVTITAGVTSSAGVPAGTVTFYDGATALGTGSVNSSGQATLSTSSLTAGSHSITASYAGNSNFASSTSAALTQTVNKANTTTAISTQSPNPSVAGQPVAVNFTVTPVAPGSGTPTGNVTVSDGLGDACTATPAAGGCSLVFATAGESISLGSFPELHLRSGSRLHAG